MRGTKAASTRATAGRKPARAATRSTAKTTTRATKAAAPRKTKAATERKPARKAAEQAAPRKVDGRSTNGRKPANRAANGTGRASVRESAPETIRKPRRAKAAEPHAEHSIHTAAHPAPKKRGRPRTVVEAPVEMPSAEEHHEETADMDEAEHS